jgi:hypothetical protein
MGVIRQLAQPLASLGLSRPVNWRGLSTSTKGIIAGFTGTICMSARAEDDTAADKGGIKVGLTPRLLLPCVLVKQKRLHPAGGTEQARIQSDLVELGIAASAQRTAPGDIYSSPVCDAEPSMLVDWQVINWHLFTVCFAGVSSAGHCVSQPSCRESWACQKKYMSCFQRMQ